MKRIRLVLNDLQTYGGQRVALDLAAALRPEFDPELLVWNQLDAPASYAGMNVTSLRRGSGGIPGFARQLAAVTALQRRDPLPLISFMTYANILALAANRLSRRNQPVVASEHNVPGLNLGSLDRRPELKFRLMRWLFPSAAAVVCVTDDVSEDLSHVLGLPRDMFTTIHNPVDVEGIRRAAAAPPPHPWLADATSPVVVCPSAHRASKGQERLLLALAERPGWRAIFLGDGVRQHEFERLASRLELQDRVAFVGFQPDPYPWMGHADAVVVPSRWEGFGLVAVEAAASGSRVVGSDALGLAEVLRRIGASLVHQDGPHDDADFAHRLAEKLDEVLPGPVPRYDLDGFEPRRVAQQYVGLLGFNLERQ